MKKGIKGKLLLILVLTLLSVVIGCSVLKSPAVSDSAEEPYEIIIETQTLGEEMPDLEAVEEAVNAITLPALNCKIKLLNISIADHRSVIRLRGVVVGDGDGSLCSFGGKCTAYGEGSSSTAA